MKNTKSTKTQGQQLHQTPEEKLVASITSLLNGKSALDHFGASGQEITIRAIPTGYMLWVSLPPIEGQ